MDQKCKHCKQIVLANFCGNCGQKRYSRIDSYYLLEELYDVLIYANKGFLYSVRKVIANPGKTAKSFIEGDRIKLYKPILLSFVLSGIAALISFQFIELEKPIRAYYAERGMDNPITNEFVSLFASYNSIFMLLMVPFFALLTKLSFRKWGHNYYEHIVMNAFILSFITLLNIIIFYPITYFYLHNPSAIFNILSISLLTTPFVLFWFFSQFYNKHSTKQIIIRLTILIGWFILFYIGIIILAILGTVLFKLVA